MPQVNTVRGRTESQNQVFKFQAIYFHYTIQPPEFVLLRYILQDISLPMLLAAILRGRREMFYKLNDSDRAEI